MLGEANCPIYAIRVVHKAKVLSHHAESTLGDIGIESGDLLLLVVVRDGAAPRIDVPVKKMAEPIQPSGGIFMRRASFTNQNPNPAAMKAFGDQKKLPPQNGSARTNGGG